MPLLIQQHPKIITKNKGELLNDWFVPIFNIHDGLVVAAQQSCEVYLTVIAPRRVRGHISISSTGVCLLAFGGMPEL